MVGSRSSISMAGVIDKFLVANSTNQRTTCRRRVLEIRERSCPPQFGGEIGYCLDLPSIPAIFIAVCVFHADLYAPTGFVVIKIVVPAVPVSVGSIPVSVVPFCEAVRIRVAITACIAAAHSPVRPHFAVGRACIIVFVATHPPVAAHLTIVGSGLPAARLRILRLLRISVSLSRNCFGFLIGWRPRRFGLPIRWRHRGGRAFSLLGECGGEGRGQ